MSDNALVLTGALDLFGEQAESLSKDEWSAASPCQGWRAMDVLSHVTGTLNKTLTTLGGGDQSATPGEAVMDAAVDEAVARWNDAAGRVADGLLTADPAAKVPSGDGEVTVAEALSLPAVDLIVHAWDIAAAAGRDLEIPTELREHVESVVARMPEEQLRSEGMFGPQVQVSQDAGPTERLMAFLGRSRP